MMYPLLTDFHFESPSDIPKNPFDALTLMIKEFPKSIVQNGEQKGRTLSSAIRFYGREILGKDGASTSVFKNSRDDIIPYIGEKELNESEAMIYPFGIVENLIASNGFQADRLLLNSKVGLYEKDSFMLIFALSGEFKVSHFGGAFMITPGNMVFVPADFRVEVIGEGKLIIAHTYNVEQDS